MMVEKYRILTVLTDGAIQTASGRHVGGESSHRTA